MVRKDEWLLKRQTCGNLRTTPNGNDFAPEVGKQFLISGGNIAASECGQFTPWQRVDAEHDGLQLKKPSSMIESVVPPIRLEHRVINQPDEVELKQPRSIHLYPQTAGKI